MLMHYIMNYTRAKKNNFQESERCNALPRTPLAVDGFFLGHPCNLVVVASKPLVVLVGPDIHVVVTPSCIASMCNYGVQEVPARLVVAVGRLVPSSSCIEVELVIEHEPVVHLS